MHDPPRIFICTKIFLCLLYPCKSWWGANYFLHFLFVHPSTLLILFGFHNNELKYCFQTYRHKQPKSGKTFYPIPNPQVKYKFNLLIFHEKSFVRNLNFSMHFAIVHFVIYIHHGTVVPPQYLRGKHCDFCHNSLFYWIFMCVVSFLLFC